MGIRWAFTGPPRCHEGKAYRRTDVVPTVARSGVSWSERWGNNVQQRPTSNVSLCLAAAIFSGIIHLAPAPRLLPASQTLFLAPTSTHSYRLRRCTTVQQTRQRYTAALAYIEKDFVVVDGYHGRHCTQIF